MTGRVRTAAAALWLWAAACGGGSPEAALTAANDALAVSDWDGAAQAASEGLALKKGDAGIRWQLELVCLEAWARGGKGDEAERLIRRLAVEYPPQVTAALYARTAAWLEEAGDPEAAARVREAGLERFPTEPLLGGTDPAGGSAPAPPRPAAAAPAAEPTDVPVPEPSEPALREEVPAPVGAGPQGAEAEDEAAAGPAPARTEPEPEPEP